MRPEHEQPFLADGRADGAPSTVRRAIDPPDRLLIRLTPQEPWQATRRRPACPERHNLHQSQWLALVRRAQGIWTVEDALQPLEALGRHGGLCPDDGRSGRRGRRAGDRHDRRDLPESAPHGFEPAGEKGRCGCLIGRTKGGLNTKLHAVTDAKGRPLRFFMTAGQVSDHTGAAALLSSLPGADWLLADRGYDADWFRDALKDRGSGPASRAGSPAASPSNMTSAATNAATGSRSCSAG